MKPITRDISLTLIVKLLLLFLLWWVCVRTMHPKLDPGNIWLFGHQKQIPSQKAIQEVIR
ncbi:cytochrome oxidase putative small subunit CydP [Legionella sp. km772]|uniref:cytochrome oxidase putative small subunit CydP n=1 Tax=Legionella sp. km772 TaxID=2498111 RepID=UPI003519DA0E